MKTNKTLKVIGSAALMASSTIPQTMVVFAEEPAQEIKETPQPKTQVLMKDLETAIQNETKAQQEVETIESKLNATYTEIAGAQETYDEAMTQRIEQEEAIDETLVQQLAESTAQLENLEAQYEQSMKEKEELESELAQKQTQLEEEEAKLVEAEQELEQAKAEYEALEPGIFEETSAKVQEANDAATNAENTLIQTQTDLANAQAQYDIHAQELASLQASYDQATASVAAAQVNYDQALAVQAEKEAALTQAKDEETYALATAELQNAQNAVLAAQDALAQSEQQVANAQVQLASAQEALNNASTDLQKYEQAVTDAKNVVNSAQNEVSQAEQELKQAQAVNTQKVEAQKVAEAALQKAQDEVNAQKSVVETANEEVEKVQQKIEDRKAYVQQLETKLKELQDQYATGSAGFFQYLANQNNEDAARAYKIITATDTSMQDGYNKATNFSEYTHLGMENDATNLENMKIAIDNLNMVNEYRKKENSSEGTTLSDLKVSSSLMAIAQRNLNIYPHKSGHCQAYAVGENLAQGYINPFEGWYDEEKVDYKAQTPDAITGHYENIVDPGYLTMGYAYLTTNDLYHTAWGQVFVSDYSTYNQGSVSVFEYQQSFNTYYNSLMNDIERIQNELNEENNLRANSVSLAQLEAELETKKQELQKQNELLEQKNANVTVATNALQAANTEVASANDLVASADINLKQKTEDLNKANATLEQKEKDLEDYLNSPERVALNRAVENAQTNLSLAQTLHTQNGNVLVQARTMADAKQNALTALDQAIEQARNDLKVAQDDVLEKQDILDQAKDTAKSIKTRLDSQTVTTENAQTQVNALTAQEAQQANTLNALKATYESANETLMTLNGIRERYTNAVNDQSQIENLIKNLKTEIPILRNSINLTNSNIDENTSQQTSLRMILADIDRAKTAWESVKNNQNAIFESSYEGLAALPDLFKQYQALKANEQQEKSYLESLIADADTSVETLRQAKTNYELAKDARIKAEKALEDFFASIDDKNAIVIDTNKKDQTTKDEKTAKDESSEKEDSSKKEEKTATTVNTAAETGLFVYTAGTVLSGALAAAFLKRKKTKFIFSI